MYHLYSKKITSIVTGVTGLLRAFRRPRNSVYALPHIAFSHPVTPVTGFFTRAHGKKIHFSVFPKLNLLNPFLKNLSREAFSPVTPVTLVTTIDFKYFFLMPTRNNPVTNEGVPVTMAIK